MGRPGLAPLGPRTRTSSRMSTMVLSDALKSPPLPSEIIDASIEEEDSPSTPSASSRDLKTDSPVVDQGAAPAYYHEHDEEEREEPEQMIEPPLTARPVVSEPLAPVPFPRETPSPEPIAEPMPVAPVASTPSSSRASTPVIVPKVISSVPVAPPPKLVPPPVIKFETTPVPWKHLPLEAALCKYFCQQCDCHTPLLIPQQGRSTRKNSRVSFHALFDHLHKSLLLNC